MNLTFRMLQHMSLEVTVTKTTIKFKHDRGIIPNKKSNENEKVNENKQTYNERQKC